MCKLIMGAVLIACLLPAIATAQDDELYSGHWVYHESVDQMTDKREMMAVIASQNEEVLNGYSAVKRRAFITIYDPDKLIAINATGAGFACPMACEITVRFDDNKAESYIVYHEPQLSDILKFDNPKRFVKRMANASKVRIALPVVSTGQAIMVYDVAGFDYLRFSQGN